MLFGKNNQAKDQAAQPGSGYGMPEAGMGQASGAWAAAGYPTQPSGTGFAGYTPGNGAQGAQAGQRYGQVQGGMYGQAQGYVPGGAGYGQNASNYAQASQGFAPVGQGFGQGGTNAGQMSQGYGFGGQTVGQGYVQSSQGYAQGGQNYAQGMGYGQMGQGTAPTGVPQGNGQGGSAYWTGAQRYGQMNQGYAQGGYTYPQMGPGYGAQMGYAQAQAGQMQQGYPAGGMNSPYAQMGRNQPPQDYGRQIPLNGGGYVPPAVPVRRQPFMFKTWMLILLGVLLGVLFGVGLILKNQVLLWIFAVLALGSVAFFWIRPVVSGNRRLCYSIIFGVLTVVALLSALGVLSPRKDATRTPGQTASQGTSASSGTSAGTVVDPQTGNVISAVEVTEAPATNTPVPEDNSAATRLETFFRYWSANRQDEMLTLCSPTWQSKQDNPKKALFGLLANRTPLDYTMEKISGTAEDSSRTVTVTSTIDRNNGKDPVKYRLSVLMVREGDTWFVDPQSLKSYEQAETPDPALAATPTPTPEPVVNANTVLYYNPDGGKQYHLDAYCKSVHEKYQPLKGHFTFSQINDADYIKLTPCNVCAAPLRP